MATGAPELQAETRRPKTEYPRLDKEKPRQRGYWSQAADALLQVDGVLVEHLLASLPFGGRRIQTGNDLGFDKEFRKAATAALLTQFFNWVADSRR